jgi:hypothetical protein
LSTGNGVAIVRESKTMVQKLMNLRKRGSQKGRVDGVAAGAQEQCNLSCGMRCVVQSEQEGKAEVEE